jgi:hypothetical protein
LTCAFLACSKRLLITRAHRLGQLPGAQMTLGQRAGLRSRLGETHGHVTSPRGGGRWFRYCRPSATAHLYSGIQVFGGGGPCGSGRTLRAAGLSTGTDRYGTFGRAVTSGRNCRILRFGRHREKHAIHRG